MLKKITAFLLAMLMVFSFAACGNVEDEPETTDPQATEPQPTEPEATDPEVEQLEEVTYFLLTLTQEAGKTQSLTAYTNDDGSVYVDYVGEITKKGNVDGSAMATITDALETSGLPALNGVTEGEVSEIAGSMYVICGEETFLMADYYGEIPEAFTSGYAAMEQCFQELTADIPEYVPAPLENGEIADSDRAALDAILAGMELDAPDSYMISGIAKDEYFAYSVGLSSDEGIASAVSFAPMMMTSAASLNIVTLEEDVAADAVAADFEDNIDWLKWICVQPGNALIATKDNQVLCLLGSDAFYTQFAAAIEAAGWTTYTTLENPNM